MSDLITWGPLDADVSPAECARLRKEHGRTPAECCPMCGAIGYGNLHCERCVLTWRTISDESRWWLLRYTKIRIEWRPAP